MHQSASLNLSLQKCIELDLEALAGVSKMGKRKIKEEKVEEVEEIVAEETAEDTDESCSVSDNDSSSESEVEEKKKPVTVPTKELSIWVGNLSYKTTADALKTFLTDCGDILKIEMPAVDGKSKGFANVYFSTSEAVAAAIQKSETELDGRKLLIKCGVDYTRKKKKGNHKESPCVFVGNLSFNTTVDQLKNLFKKFGSIYKVRMATFEDSGKCKGFAYVDYKELKSAKDCLKSHFNLNGRKLNVEYASDEATKKGRPWEQDKHEE